MKRILSVMLLLITMSVSLSAKKGAYCFFQDGKNVYEDANVLVSIEIRGSYIDLEIKNKTNNVLYVDKGISFAFKNNEPVCMFQNTSHTTGTSKDNGASVNLGAIAGAAGIGDLVGGLASGINVGGGKSVQDQTTTYEKRIIALAPQAKSLLYKWTISKEDIAFYLNKKYQEGRIFDFDENGSPCVIKAVVNYSNNENMQSAIQFIASTHVVAIVVDSSKGVYYDDLNKTKYCEKYRSLPFFSFSF